MESKTDGAVLDRLTALLGDGVFFVPCEWGTKRPLVTYVERPFEVTETGAVKKHENFEPSLPPWPTLLSSARDQLDHIGGLVSNSIIWIVKERLRGRNGAAFVPKLPKASRVTSRTVMVVWLKFVSGAGVRSSWGTGRAGRCKWPGE